MKINKKLTQTISMLTTTLLLISYTPPVFSDSNEYIPEKESVIDDEESTEELDTIATTETTETTENNLINESTNSSVLEETTEASNTSVEETASSESSESIEETIEETTLPSNSSEEEVEQPSTTDSSVELPNASSTTEASSTPLPPTSVPSSSQESSNEDSKESVSTEGSKESLEQATNKPTITTPVQNNYPVLSRAIEDQSLAKDFIASDLNGFELPNLSFYQNKNQAAIVYASLKLLSQPYQEANEEGKGFDHLGFIQSIYNNIFGLSLTKDFDDLKTIGEKIEIEEAQIGDLLIWEKEQKMAIYLGQNKFIMADDTLLKEQISNQQTEEELAEIPGVRIFTLHLNQMDDENGYDQDLLKRYDFIQAPSHAIQIKPELSLSAYGQEQIKNYPVTFNFQENEQTLAFIDLISESARTLGLKYDLFASVLIAQAILESGSGTSGLARAPFYNLFGIKGGSSSSSVILPTQEDDGQGNLFSIASAFRVYPTYEDSLADYVSLIRNGITSNSAFYQDVWRSNAKNYLQATSELTGKYATDTSYYNKLNSIIAAYHLTQFDEPKVEVGDMLQNVNQIPLAYREKMIFPEFNGQNYNTSGSYGMDQCTWYAFNRVTQLGGKVGDYMGNGADWKESGIAQGYKTSTIPKAGYVISFKQGVAGYHPLYGHVAFVEAVTNEGILISEGDASYLSYRVIPNEIALSNSVGYLIPK